MEASELKINFHSLINRFQNTQLLAHFYSIMTKVDNPQSGLLWESLSKAEQDELIASELESFDETQLVLNSEMKHKHRKWL